jgi:hypothetical protein
MGGVSPSELNEGKEQEKDKIMISKLGKEDTEEDQWMKGCERDVELEAWQP